MLWQRKVKIIYIYIFKKSSLRYCSIEVPNLFESVGIFGFLILCNGHNCKMVAVGRQRHMYPEEVQMQEKRADFFKKKVKKRSERDYNQYYGGDYW